MEGSNKKIKMVYTVVNRDNDRSRWLQIGVGFVNKDDSITVKLDAHPTNGTLQIRDWRPRENGP